MNLQPLMGKFSIAPNSSSPSLSSLSNLPADGSQNESHEEKSAPKRNACNTCRKRKLRCDGGSPACGRCTRLHHECEYSERRRKSGPRRGYVKVLETRLAQVEGLLKDKEVIPKMEGSLDIKNNQYSIMYKEAPDVELDAIFNTSNVPQVSQEEQKGFSMSYTPVDADLLGPSTIDDFSWAMIELGVDEPLPPHDTVDELTQIYFAKVHPTAPMIHQFRFLSSMSLAPHQRPSAALRYAMWTLAASVSDKYRDLHSLFYGRARKYVEADERSSRQKYLNVRHAQTLILLAIYESKMMLFPTSWLTTGRATRMTQMMGLYRIDGTGTESKQSLPTAADWGEKEERRRTFWMSFCMDRYSNIGTGWPVIIDERDICSYLPSSEEAFPQNTEVDGITLRDAMENPLVASKISAFGGNVIIASLSGTILSHLNRPSPDNDDGNPNGYFWKNHRKIDNILLNTSLCLPSHLRLPAGLSNANIIFLNMSLHAGTICLHQDSIFKAEQFELSSTIIAESKSRCLTAATEICSIMKTIAHIDLSFLNVYTPFVLYLATRVFGQIWKNDPENDFAKSSLRFMLSAMLALKEYIPLAESNLIQLDLEGIGLTAMEGRLPSYSSVEGQMAGMSLRGATDEASWISYVTPLVKIHETSSNSTPTATVSSGRENSKPSPAANQECVSVPEETFTGEQRDPALLPDSLSDFATNGDWELGQLDIPPEMFEHSGEMDMTFWNQQ